MAGRLGVPPGGAVLGADTEVILDGRALGKPADREAAAAMLAALSGRAHTVRSAVCVITQRDRAEVCDETRVVFAELAEPLREWYLDLGEWRERAGGYAIQGAGAALVARIEGDYTTVVGLPVAALAATLGGLGLAPWSAAPAILRTDTGGEGER